MSSGFHQVCILFMGEEFVADVDYDITSYGNGLALHPMDPDRDDPDWHITEISLRRDLLGGDLGPAFAATGALFDVLSNDSAIVDEIEGAVFKEAREFHEERRSRRRYRSYV